MDRSLTVLMLTRRKTLATKQELIMKLNVMITLVMTKPNHSSTTSHAKPSNVQKARCNAQTGVRNEKLTLKLLDSHRTVVESEYHQTIIKVLITSTTLNDFFQLSWTSSEQPRWSPTKLLQQPVQQWPTLLSST